MMKVKSMSRAKPLLLVLTLVYTVFSMAPIPNVHANASQTISLNGSTLDRVFEGIGAVSAGASSRLLVDYADPYRSQILDYLFTPNFGAAFQHLKVEIGGDTNSTDGSEPSFAHTRSQMSSPNFNNCYELWLAQEARNRNSSIYLDALQWGAPGWIGNGNINSQDNADYLVKFLQGAQSVYGLSFNYIGGAQNERFSGAEDAVRNYIVNNLRPALNNNGFTNVKIVAADYFHPWSIADRVITDPAYRDALGAIGCHYTGIGWGSTTDNAKNCGVPAWASETWGWDIDGCRSNESDVIAAGGWYLEAAIYAKLFNGKALGKMTKSEIWAPVFACLPGLPYDATGLIKCREPWSGYYEVRPILWAVAHTTQFTQPGWTYLGGTGCGYLSAGGSYVTLKKSDGNYSIIIETSGATATQDITFNTSNLSTGAKDVWMSYGNSDSTWFQKTQNGVFSGQSSFTISNIAPDSIVTVTSWRNGQTKGTYATPPTSASFPFPYSENFDSYSVGGTPKYLSDQQGTFEIYQAAGENKCLRQMAPQAPINWGNDTVSTLFGDPNWSDYRIKVDVYAENSGEIGISGRGRYAFDISTSGAWHLYDMNNNWATLASGTHSITTGTWHTIAMNFSGSNVQLFIDNMTTPISIVDIGSGTGMARLFVGNNYNQVRFDNLTIDSGGGATPTPTPVGTTIPQSQMTATATSYHVGYEPLKAIDGNNSTMWHTEWSPMAYLPQSITLNLGGTYNVTTIKYLPRQDGNQNGRITGYNVYTSTNGTSFTPVASGTWTNDASEKTASFTATSASYIRLEATSAGGGYASAAEINVLTSGGGPTPTPTPGGGGNLVTNPGFEAEPPTQTPTGWPEYFTTSASYTQVGGGGPHSGSYNLAHWSSAAYQVATEQTITGLANGTYTMKAWVQSSGGQNWCCIYANGYGGSQLTTNLPTTSTWTQIQITGINVTNGQCTIGLWSDANANNWCTMDDVEFYKN